MTVSSVIRIIVNDHHRGFNLTDPSKRSDGQRGRDERRTAEGTESAGRRGVPDDVLLKVRVIVRRLGAEGGPGSGPGDSGRSLELWRNRGSKVTGLFGRTFIDSLHKVVVSFVFILRKNILTTFRTQNFFKYVEPTHISVTFLSYNNTKFSSTSQILFFLHHESYCC